MQPEAFLPALADIALMVAGFTAAIASIRVGQRRPWHSQELFRTLGPLIMCLVSFLSAALPFALSGLPVPTEAKWAVPLVLSGAVNFLIPVWFLKIWISKEITFLLPLLTVPVLAILGILSVISVLSGFGVLLPYSAGILVLGLSWAILLSAIGLVAGFVYAARNSLLES